MRLVNCTECDDIFRPISHERVCECGKTRAQEVTNGTGDSISLSGPGRVLALRWDQYDGAVVGRRYIWRIVKEPAAGIERES